MQGLTLIELMVSMVLGLVVVGGAISLTLANRQSYRTNEGLSQVQESARTAFELIARDVRQAGVSGCDNEGRVANVVDTSGGTDWWMDWFGILGHEDDEDTSAVDFGSNRGDRSAGTDAIQLQGIQGIALTVEDHDALAGTIEVNAATTDIGPGDVMVVCDFDHATIFQVTAYDAAAVRMTHDSPGGVTPGNCSRGLGFPTDCSSVSGNTWAFNRNSMLGRFFATDWYVGESARPEEGGRSLFRRRLAAGGGLLTEEVVTGVTDMQITYRRDGGDEFEEANAVTAAGDWDDINAVRIALTVDSAEARVSTDPDINQGRLRRTFSQIITLRNRVP